MAAGSASVRSFVDAHGFTDVSHDSRNVAAGSLFVCVPGAVHDGHDHARGAIERGASGLLTEHRLDLGVPELTVDDTRAAMAEAAHVVHGSPSEALEIAGVTGTAGKTTVTHLIGAVFARAGREAEVFGTLSGPRTTPESTDLQRALADARDRGITSIAMEVSSHALALHRVDHVAFDVAVFTNLGHDHLDFHRSMEEYFAAKARLFTSAFTPKAVVNLDDEWGRRLFAEVEAAGDVELVGCSSDEATDLRLSARETGFVWTAHDIAVRSSLIGRYNVANLVTAATACSVLGVPPELIAAGLASAQPVPGRLEVVDSGAGQPAVVVDYAHKPEALAAALESVRDLVSGQVTVVFGAGGDRDQEKRPLMGAAAEAGADRSVVTSDNPRSEDPATIAEQIVATMSAPIVELDRHAAIAAAIAMSGPDDLVLIAGKGHETTQTFADRVVEFDDRIVARQLLERPA